jgi:hypothetical protein
VIKRLEERLSTTDRELRELKSALVFLAGFPEGRPNRPDEIIALATELGWDPKGAK